MVENSLAFSQDMLIRADPVTLFNHCFCLPQMRPCIPDLEKTWDVVLRGCHGFVTACWLALNTFVLAHFKNWKAEIWQMSDRFITHVALNACTQTLRAFTCALVSCFWLYLGHITVMEHKEHGYSYPCRHDHNSSQVSEHLPAGVSWFLTISATKRWFRHLDKVFTCHNILVSLQGTPGSISRFLKPG